MRPKFAYCSTSDFVYAWLIQIWYDEFTDMHDLIDWQTCLISWTDRHAWIDGPMDMPYLMDLLTCPNWWTDRLIPDFMVWLTCLIWWTDRYAWFDGMTEMPNLMDWWTCCHLCCHCHCCCSSSWHCVIIVVGGVDYNLICILWLMDCFVLSLSFVIMSGPMLLKFANSNKDL